MVRLTMTAAAVEAVKACHDTQEITLLQEQGDLEPSLQNPVVGEPISHQQLISISKCLQEYFKKCSYNQGFQPHHVPPYRLNELLKGSRIYNEPPQQKPEPSSEYKTLMARLRREEEAKAYERMVNPLPTETFSQRFPNSPGPNISPAATKLQIEEEDEVTYADVNRQIALIANVLVSIVACSVAIWMASSHWSTPRRLGLSMSGSGLVGIAEVVVYAGYLRRVREAKDRGRRVPEMKEVIDTWVIDSKGKESKLRSPVLAPSMEARDQNLKQRKLRMKE